MTTVNLGRIKSVWRGEWASGTAYARDDVVKEGVNSYICVQAHTSGATFAGDSANWNVMAVGAEIPSQTGQAGNYLKSDGSNLSWQPVITKVVNVEHFAGYSGRLQVNGNTQTEAVLANSLYTAERSDTFLVITADIHAQTDGDHYGIAIQYQVNGGGWFDCIAAQGSRGFFCATYDDNLNNLHSESVTCRIPSSAYNAGDTIKLRINQSSHTNSNYVVYGGSPSGWGSHTYGRGNHVIYEIIE